jgi:REP element-mobilizing transposase RayT
MAVARNRQISLADTPYYHCVSRCVRRAFLCGEDKSTGQNYEHRRAWVEKKLLALTDVFAIDVCAYAVMSNHVHIVFHANVEKAEQWSNKAVIEQWHQLFKGTLLTQKFMRGEHLPDYLMVSLEETVEEYRRRLTDISWFMRILNEDIARKANREDNCIGRFWEGRFKSQALLDETALAACMAYVDLNPVRAAIAETPENSEYTSIKKRIDAANTAEQPKQLLAFVGYPRKNLPTGIPFELNDYIELIELTGRCIRDDKRGFIDNSLPTILERLAICPENWLKIATEFRHIFHGAVGHEEALTDFSAHLHLKRRQNLSTCQQYLA